LEFCNYSFAILGSAEYFLTFFGFFEVSLVCCSEVIWSPVGHFYYGAGFCSLSSPFSRGRGRKENTRMRRKHFQMIKPTLSFNYFNYYGGGYLLGFAYFTSGL